MNSRLKWSVAAVASLASLSMGFSPALFRHIAYKVAAGTRGNQHLPRHETQSLGMDFDVDAPIKILALGVFDSGGNGLVGTLRARIYDRDTQTSIADLTFDRRNPGLLVGGSRFRTLRKPLYLPSGFHGTISVAYLGNRLEPNGNLRGGPGNWTTGSGHEAISFVGTGRHSLMGTGDAFPDIVEDTSPAPNTYAAGTFVFRRTHR